MKPILPKPSLPPAAQTALRLNRMAARAALDTVVHPAHQHRPHTRSYDVVVGMVANSIPPLDASPQSLRDALNALTAVTAGAIARTVAVEEVSAGGAPAIWVRPSAGVGE